MAQLHSVRCPGGLTHQPHQQQCKRHSARCPGGLTSHYQLCTRHHRTTGTHLDRSLHDASRTVRAARPRVFMWFLPRASWARPASASGSRSRRNTRAERLRHHPLLAEAFRAARPPRISQPSTVLRSRSLFSRLRFVCGPLDWCHVVSGHLSASFRAALIDRSTEPADPVRSLQVVCVRAARVRPAHFSNLLV